MPVREATALFTFCIRLWKGFKAIKSMIKQRTSKILLPNSCVAMSAVMSPLSVGCLILFKIFVILFVVEMSVGLLAADSILCVGVDLKAQKFNLFEP